MNRKGHWIKAERMRGSIKHGLVDPQERGDNDDLSTEPDVIAPNFAPVLPCRSRFKSISEGSLQASVPRLPSGDLRLEHALHIKSAEFWLRLGEPLEALAEIVDLPQSVRRNSWVHRLQAAATRAAREFHAKSLSRPEE